MLAFTRQCLALRNSSPALRHGAMEFVEADDARLVFERVSDDQRLRCSFNLSAQPAAFLTSGRPLLDTGNVGGELGSYAAVIEDIA
jgi:alpha-glucosidase